MSIILNKGSGYSAEYTTTDFVLLGSGDVGYGLGNDLWVGALSLYTTYPGVPNYSKAMSRLGTALILNIPNSDILNLVNGTYTAVASITNAALGQQIIMVDYATVIPVNLSASSMCKIYGTIEKLNGTPTGASSSSLVNSTDGLALQSTWKGVEVRVSISVADVDAGKVVSIEPVTTTTNAAGYFELYVLRGLTVTVTCPSFGKSVVIDTTGLAEKDISTLF